MLTMPWRMYMQLLLWRKLIKEKQPKLFQYFFENRGKKEIEKLVDTGAMRL
ncbi:exonuclease I [Haemophilus influenzae]|uniref:Exonuclease I n=1 Tax=Haemophilus influenzae TaxID=727 RepID=A0A2X1RMK1_HAEIF|nr:exonuclease I [Haemophilus influenzae]